MDRINKALKSIPRKYADTLADIIENIKNDKTTGLDVKKLRGYSNIFRVRVGKYRILYKMEAKNIEILDISKRNENTYQDY